MFESHAQNFEDVVLWRVLGHVDHGTYVDVGAADPDADRVSMSVTELLDTLGGIQETVLLYQGERGRPRARRMLTEINPTQQRLYDLFDLDTYAPKR